MKIKLMLILAAVGSSGFVVIGLTATLSPSSPPSVQLPKATTEVDDITKQLLALNSKIEARITNDQKNGSRPTPNAWADILQAYDAILTAHKNEKNDRIAQVALAKGLLYASYFNSPDISIKLLEEIIRDYPVTPTAQMSSTFLESFREEAAFLASRRQLLGQPLPDFQATDLDGKVQSRANFKGRVVLLSYWTSECVQFSGKEEMPNVKKVYDKYHGQGFEVLGVLGITLGNTASQAALPAYLQSVAAGLRAENMPWPEYCRLGERNTPGALANLPEPRSYPGNYLIGRDGKIIGVDLLGDDLDTAVAKAVGVK